MISLTEGSSVVSVAEGVGFEPTDPCGSAVFKTAAIDHSATPPRPRGAHRIAETRRSPAASRRTRPRGRPLAGPPALDSLPRGATHPFGCRDEG